MKGVPLGSVHFMSFSLLSIAILMIFAAVTAIEVYKGIKNGFGMSLVSFGVTLTALLLSLLVSPIISMLLALFLNNFLQRLQLYQNILDMFPSVGSVVIAVINMVIGMLLFIVVFFILRALIKLVVKLIFNGRTAKKKDDPGYMREDNAHSENSNRFGGAVIGFLSGVLVTMILTCPIMGILDIADSAIGIVKQVNSSTLNFLGEENVNTVRALSGDLPGNVFYQLGGKYIFNAAASSTIDGERVYLLSEIENIDNVTGDLMDGYKFITNPESDIEGKSEIIDNLCKGLVDIKLCRPVLSDILRNISSAWLDDSSYFGVARPSMNEIVDPAVDEILLVCKNTSIKSVRYNVTTVLKIYSVVLDSGIMDISHMEYSEIISCLDNGGLLDKLDQVLRENPYMSGINVSSIALSAVSTHLNGVNIDQDKYNELMENIAYAINSVNNRGYGSLEEKIDILTDYAQGYFDDLGNFEVPSEITREVAKELLESMSGSEVNVTAEDITELFSKFAK